MKRPHLLHTILIAALSSVSLVAAVACSDPPKQGGDDDPGENPPDGPIEPPPEGCGDYVFPFMANTGFDGTNTYQVPLATSLSGAVTWEVEDPSIVSVAPASAPEQYAEFGETWAMVTSKKAGTTRVFAVQGTTRIESTIIVTQYDAAKVAVGKTRYNTPEPPAGAQRVACVSCHGLDNGVDHTPLEMAFYGDEEILSAVTTGKYPDGYVLTGVNHAWNVTEAEKAGIVPYLRSLPPSGF